VVLADYVTTEDGSGLVHQAPAFGADDLKTCRSYDLPTINPVRPDGHFEVGIELVGDLFFKDADKPIVKDLKQRGLLYKHQPYEHQYPHCWRCHTALIYYAQPSWYIRTTSIKDALIRENQNTDWHPETIKTGRYGDWLNNNIDWALSRNRYWGTPLPIWRCENKHEIAIGSLKELGELAGQELSNLDPHRPFVDDIKIPCADCKLDMVRVPEVIDCWYDSGAMPFAQWGYPHKPGSEEKFKNSYPADFICEAIDQTRGWFYTLMTIGTLVFDQSSYKTVLCLGHILDKDGRKMSKHLGNVLEPMALMDQHGADAVRWFMLAAGSPWAARRVGHDAIQEVIRKTLLTYWNTISFMSLYARASKFDLSQTPAQASRPIMDRWILSELQLLVKDVDAAYADFDSQTAGRLLATFIDDLSNWYVRRSRRRFWDGDPAALATLHECIKVLTQLMSPMVPFITEHVWQELIKPVEANSATSVHLTSWPDVNEQLIDLNLRDQVALTRRIVELGRAARAESSVKIRQPLGRALIAASGWSNLPADMRDQIADELNVLDLEDIANASGDLVSVSIKANFRALGAKYGGAVQDVAKLIAAADAATFVAEVRAKGGAKLGEYEITAEDLVITEQPKSGWSVASNNGESVALDLTLTQALINAGNVREVIRALQEGRKNAGFDISDRIIVTWNANSEMAPAVKESLDHIKREVLAVEMNQDASLLCDTELGFTFNLKLS
jgi:isoleucyl-tRNA synthetase